MSIYTVINAALDRHIGHVRNLRHQLHQIPEAGLCEHKTSRLLHTELVEAGYDVQRGYGVTGLFADLDTGRDGGYVMLRADMDGLPVTDRSGTPYHSQHEGFCHCCGHDGHTATLIGVARVLKTIAPSLRGRVRFVFQPAEETAKGALGMIEDGLLCDGPADAAFALHAWPGLPAGTVACRPGPCMAASDSFEVTIYGEGGHGARPALAKNPLTVLAQILPVLEHMTTDTRVVSPCVARVGEKVNVIAETGAVSGTIRTLDPQERERTMQELRDRVASIAAELGMRADVSFELGCSGVSTDPRLYEMFREVGAYMLGAEHVLELDKPSMGSEDFGYFLDHMPGLMFRLGIGENVPELHNPRFDFGDQALATAVRMMSGLAIRICNGNLS